MSAPGGAGTAAPPQFKVGGVVDVEVEVEVVVASAAAAVVVVVVF